MPADKVLESGLILIFIALSLHLQQPHQTFPTPSNHCNFIFCNLLTLIITSYFHLPLPKTTYVCLKLQMSLKTLSGSTTLSPNTQFSSCYTCTPLEVCDIIIFYVLDHVVLFFFHNTLTLYILPYNCQME